MVRIIMIISITALAWSRYEISLYKEQNQNLVYLIQELEDEAKVCSKALAEEKKKPNDCDRLECPAPQPCFEVVYTGDSCEPCRCYDNEDE